MSAEPKAVFLSYASQDAEAAKRIADALRAAGVEVWFDTDGGLEHGDEWDAKIRRQIKECVLFLPIISANTQAREEGYFRIEWELAAQRAMGIASGVAFVLPVVIDDTKEPAALVPDRFRTVQWTRLPGGNVPPDVLQRFLKLWSHRTGGLKHSSKEPVAGSAEQASPPASARRGGMARGHWLGVGALVCLVALAAYFVFQPRRSPGEITRLPAPAQTGVATPAKATLTETASSRTVTGVDDKSVAVLAFADLSAAHDSEYFSDGISEELLNVLAKVPGLKVAARTSAFYFKGKDVPIPEIAQKLDVAYVVEGSVRRQGDKVRITAQLIKADGGFHVWSDTFTRDLKDIFAVQDEIAGLIAKNLELKMGMGDAAPRQAVSPEAYQEYLLGRAAAAKAGMADLHGAAVHFERAAALEPKYTAAWVQLATTHTQLGRWGGAPTLQSWASARAAIDRARALEPDSPEVLLALGWILRTADWDWKGAERAFRRALALQPNQPEILAGAAVLLYNIGQKEEAFRLAGRAIQLDPLNAASQIDLSIMYYENDNWAEAEQAARRALQLAPGGTSYHSILSWNLIKQGRYAEAETEIAQDTDRVEQSAAYGLLAIARGEGAKTREMLARLQEVARAQGDIADVQQCIAWLYTGLGEKDHAFAALEKARATRDPSMSWLRNTSELKALGSDPRWGALLHQVGLGDEQLR